MGKVTIKYESHTDSYGENIFMEGSGIDLMVGVAGLVESLSDRLSRITGTEQKEIVTHICNSVLYEISQKEMR